MRNLLVTGAAGFIGANFVQHMLEKYDDYTITVFDKMTYAGNLDNLAPVAADPRYRFVQGDIADAAAVSAAIEQHDIDTLVNFAAETHVDRSIMQPDAFIKTNVYGSYVLLEAMKKYKLERGLFVSTDEVYGHIPAGYSSRESDPLVPRSPYSASKASGDLLVYSYHVTDGLPTLITRGTNNIGPYQYPEKAVPLFVTNALDEEPLPIYGDGRQMRDYQFVLDHCEGIDIVLHKGVFGEAYNIGSGVETENIVMARALLDLLGKPHDLIHYVADRAGHDRRYSVNTEKVRALGWRPRHDFAAALEKTVRWYADNEAWWRKIKTGAYLEYYRKQYVERV